MPLSGFSSKLLIGGRPRLEFDTPKVGKDGQWLLSGRMVLEFVSRPSVPVRNQVYGDARGLEITVCFSDAESEHEAVRQAALVLRQIGFEIEAIASTLLGESQLVAEINSPPPVDAGSLRNRIFDFLKNVSGLIIPPR